MNLVSGGAFAVCACTTYNGFDINCQFHTRRATSLKDPQAKS